MINKQNILFLSKYPIRLRRADTLCKGFIITKFYHVYCTDVDFRFYRELHYLTHNINKFIYDFKNNK